MRTNERRQARSTHATLTCARCQKLLQCSRETPPANHFALECRCCSRLLARGAFLVHIRLAHRFSEEHRGQNASRSFRKVRTLRGWRTLAAGGSRRAPGIVSEADEPQSVHCNSDERCSI